MAHVKLTPKVRAILERSTITSSTLTLPQQLPPKLYQAVMKVIKNCGGEWRRGPQCHVFGGDPRAKLGLTLATGVAMDDKKTFQFFPTPPGLANIIAIRAHVRGCSVLEPSAGHGALVKACIAEGANRVAMVELNPDNLPYLKSVAKDAQGKAACCIHIADFLTLTPANAPIGHRCQFERIVMNPPFTKGQDLKHIAHAVTHWLRPGGELAAVLLPHTDEEISQALDGGRHGHESPNDQCSWTTEDIDAGTFKESGTNIRTQLLLLEKSALAPEPILPPIPIISPVAVEEWMSDLPLFDYLTPATVVTLLVCDTISLLFSNAINHILSVFIQMRPC